MIYIYTYIYENIYVEEGKAETQGSKRPHGGSLVRMQK